MADNIAHPSRKILVALDDSDYSQFALSWTLDTLMISPHTDLIFLLHVQAHDVVLGPVGPGFYTTAEILQSMRKHEEEISEKVLHRAKAICDERHLHTETMTAIGDPREAICETAEKLHVDFLVVGSHGYGALKRPMRVQTWWDFFLKLPIDLQHEVIKRSNTKSWTT